jgi:predicted nucleic acid-binding protein
MQPTERVRVLAERLMSAHPLKAADALQLAAAFRWAAEQPGGYEFVSLDGTLRTAAAVEGFTVLPT